MVYKFDYYWRFCKLNVRNGSAMEFSMTRNVHVVPHADGWAVRIEGNERVSSIHDTQGDAIGQARDRARRDHSELLIHGENGQIRDRDSYGNDPSPPKG